MALGTPTITDLGTGTGTISGTHSPASTPRAALVLVGHTGGADEIASNGVTYGGVQMTETPDSPVLVTAGDEDGSAYAYFLGAGIPTGAQTVQVQVTGSSNKRAVVITWPADADTEVGDTGVVNSGSIDDPSVALAAGAEAVAAAVYVSGLGNPANITPDGAQTTLVEWDIGTRVVEFSRLTSPDADGSFTLSWTTDSADDAAILAVAIIESGAPPAGPPAGGLALLGAGT